MPGQHRPSCAKRLRLRAAEENWTAEQTADAVVRCCGVSRLRAYRFAHGWTLRAAVAEFHLLCEQQNLNAPKLDEDQLGVWETRVDRQPRAGTVDLLCRLYRTNAQGLGLTGDYRAAEEHGKTAPVCTASPSTSSLPAPHATTSRSSPVGSGRDPFDERVESARRSVDRTLASASVSSGQLDLLDEWLLWLRQQYIYTPPGADAGTTPQRSGRNPVPGRRASASGGAGPVVGDDDSVLSTLVADALMKLGKVRQSRAWYATARNAADDSGNAGLRARVRAQAAMLPYYYGPLETAVVLAREARLLSRSRASATSSFAAAAEARALARQGNATGAEHSIRCAQTTFEHCDQGLEDDAFAFPERRFLLYLSGTHTYLGQTRLARAVQQRALALYPDETGIDPALLQLEEAICMAQDRSLAEACQLACATYLRVPAAHRTLILGTWARHVIDVLPAKMRSTRAARELGEVLAPPPGPM